MSNRRARTALLAAGALIAGLLSPVAFALPASAAENCDLGGFEIDGDLPVNCIPPQDDWDSVDYASTEQGGTYSSAGKDVGDPADWVAAGATPDKADFAKVYTYTKVGDDGHYYLYVGWDRTSNTGTAKYAIELTLDGANTPETGVNDIPTPQPIRDNGGAVAYIEMNGAQAPVLTQVCGYDDLASYPASVNVEDPITAGCTTDTSDFASAISDSGLFFEAGFDLTEYAGIVPDCPPVATEATVYMRSITGGSDDGNLKAFVSPLEVTPPSTCGYLDVTKVALDDVGLPDSTEFDYLVEGGENDPIEGTVGFDETDQYFDVEPGDDFTIEETIPDGAPWSQYSIVCTVGEEEFILAGPGADSDEFPVYEAETTSCVITNATSYVDVSKITNPSGETDEFTFDVNGAEETLSDGETSDPIQFAPGTEITIDEEQLDDWALGGIVCTVGGEEIDATVDLEAGTVTFDTVAGETVNCTFTNETSFVTVVKQTSPDGSAEVFDFDIDGAAFDLSDGDSETFQFAPGTDVDITEVVPAGWDLTDVTCDVDETAIDDGVTVTTVAGETVECTFTNTQRGEIIVNKVVEGVDDGTFEFLSETLGDFQITTDGGTGTLSFPNLVPGAYDVAEDAITGFDTTNLVCVDPTDDTLVDLEDFSAAIDLAPGETVECTFTNTQRGEIRVDKETVPDEYDQDFAFLFDGTDGFTLNDSSDDEANPWSSGLIEPGSYTVGETVPANWTLDDISCGSPDGSVTTIELEPGAIVTCVFTNVATPGEVSLTKSVEGVADTYEWSFDFTLTEEPEGAPVTKTVDSSDLPASATVSWGDLNVGETYTLIEDELPFGWEAGDITCTGLEDADPEADGFQFVVTPGLVLECSAVNTAIPAEVELEKTVSGLAGDVDWAFDFTITPGPNESVSDTKSASNGSPVIGWGDLIPGVVYSIVETEVPGYDSGAITCVDGEAEVLDLDPEAAGFQFVAGAGLVLECTVDNEALPGEVTVVKSTKGGDGTFTFVLTQLGDGGETWQGDATTVDGSGEASFDIVPAGARYSIAEENPGGEWEVGPMQCEVTPASGGDAVAVDAADFAVAPGDRISCAITNTIRPPMPVTGFDAMWSIWLALILAGAGGALVLVGRRRVKVRRSESTEA